MDYIGTLYRLVDVLLLALYAHGMHRLIIHVVAKSIVSINDGVLIVFSVVDGNGVSVGSISEFSISKIYYMIRIAEGSSGNRVYMYIINSI